MKAFRKEFLYQLRWALPIWFLKILTNWWPNNRITISIRGKLYKPFFKKCGKNLQIASGVVLLNTNNIEIGDNVYLSYSSWLNGMGGLTIGDEVIIGPRVTISTLSHNYQNKSFRFGGATSAPVKIGSGTWLAAHATVKSGVTIGQGCLVGANSSVVKDVGNGLFVGGVPAKTIGPCEEKELLEADIIMSRSGFTNPA